MELSFFLSGDKDIDRVRKEASETPTNERNYEERLVVFYTWQNLLQRQGADTISYIPVYNKYVAAYRSGKQKDLFSLVNEGFQVLDRIQASLSKNPPTSMPSKGGIPKVSKETPPTDWPVYGGNPHQTSYTEDSGPVEGKLAWRRPIGLAWYSRPAVENRRVYAVSPGMRTILYCLDTETGKVIWKTRREPSVQGGVNPFATHGAASSPVVLKNTIVVNEIGAQWGEFAARDILYISKSDGKVVKKVRAGTLDYRAGYSIVAGNEDFLIFPDSAQMIAKFPPHIVGTNRIVCKETSSGETLWDFYIGPTFSEPLLNEDCVYVGTSDGVFFCLNVKSAKGVDIWGSPPRERVTWQFKLGGAANSSPTVWEDKVCVGANDGVIYCLNKETGDLVWRREVEPKESRAFKFFSTPRIVDGCLYIGAANKHLYCLDVRTGELIWDYRANDWIRTRPVCIGKKVYFATMDGTIQCLDQTGGKPKLVWKAKAGTHPIFSDLVSAEGKIFVNSSDLFLWCLDAEDGSIIWRHSLLECIYKDGERVPADEVAAVAGGHFQSKPTVANGKVFIGTPSRFVYALDYKTGKELWRFELGAAVSGAPAYSKGRVFFGQQGGEEYFYCVDATDGRMIWKQTLSWVLSSANVSDGRIFVPGVDGYVNCLREEDGAILWRYRTGRAAHPEPPVDRGRVYFGSWDHFEYALEIEDGRVVWQFYTAGRPDSGSPIADEGRLYLPMGGGGDSFRCLDTETGKIIWEHRLENLGYNASPALHNGRVFISTSVSRPVASRIYCLDAETGKVIWEHRGGGITAPAVADGKVYFASTADPFFYCVDEKGNDDGTTTCLWKYKMGDRVYESHPAIYGGLAYILCRDSYLYAFK